MKIEYIKTRLILLQTRPPQALKISAARSVLLEELQGCEQQIMIVRGGAGYGKTELVRQYCAQKGQKTFWYLMAPPSEGELDHQPPNVDVLHLFSNEEAVKNCIFVIDDYTEGEEADALLFEAVKRIPKDLQGFRLILITRGGVPGVLARYAAGGYCRIVDEEELAFTKEEQKSLLVQTLGTYRKQEDAEKFEGCADLLEGCADLLEGWPAGVMLTLHYWRKNKAAGGDWTYFIQESLIEELLNCEVFERQPEVVRNFLLQTAASARVEEAFCEKVLGMDDAKSLIKDLVRKNILLRQPVEGSGIFRYRRFFRLFLCGKLSSRACSKAVMGAADYYLECGRLDQAVREAAEIGYTELIVKLVLFHGEELLRGEDDSVLTACVDYLRGRTELLDGRRRAEGAASEPEPELLGIVAQYYHKKGDYASSERYLNQADSRFGKENKYGMYRSIYRGLLRYQEAPEKYRKQVRSALFVLHENNEDLPYLRRQEDRLLKELQGAEEGTEQNEKKLKVSVFGDFQVTVFGENRQLAWRTRKSRELFALLVDLDGGAVGRKQLLQKLWRDEMPDNAVTMLHNMLYSIRKELSSYQMAEVICYKDKAYRIDMSEIEADQTIIKYLCTLVERKDEAALEKNARWFQTYWGRYLEDMDCWWGAEAGEYYDARFFDGCVMLADLNMKRGCCQEAVTYLKNALLVNPYSEELTCLLIRCYGAMKNLKQVKCEFNRFRELLKRDLNMQPGREVEQAYEAALAG